MQVSAAPGDFSARVTGLGADAASDLEDRDPRRVAGVVVQQVYQRAGLIGQSLVLEAVVAVDILLEHRHRFDHSHQRVSLPVSGVVGVVIGYDVLQRAQNGRQPVA